MVISYLRSLWGAKSTFFTILHSCDLSTHGHWPMVMALCITTIMKLIFWLFVWLWCLFQLLFNFIVNAGEAEEETWLWKTFWDFLPGWLRIPQAFSVPFLERDYQIKRNASASYPTVNAKITFFVFNVNTLNSTDCYFTLYNCMLRPSCSTIASFPKNHTLDFDFNHTPVTVCDCILHNHTYRTDTLAYWQKSISVTLS